ncbi:MAG: hypothetical protein CL843_14890 [Crocinitomicaceae bacterium]|nr:hypothetical protein [Crocinitomicaceae bacterium]|tara:strand:- start:1715 stop:2416 length:702 start_codon:yes stop_codon:yes gene_type:complete
MHHTGFHIKQFARTLSLIITLWGSLYAALAQDFISFPNDLQLRGKVLAGPIIEDQYIFNTTLGAEKKIGKHSTIGLDYIFLYERKEKDQYDSLGYDVSLGHFKTTTKHIVLADYRYYFKTWFFSENAFALYGSAFLRLGQFNMSTVSDYDFNVGEKTEEDLQLLDAGLSVGGKLLFSLDARWGLDVNFGAAYRWSVSDYTTFQSETETTSTNNEHQQKIVALMRLNFFYIIRL